MSQSPLTSLQEKQLLVSRPLAESGVVLAFEPGMHLVLAFEPDQAAISRDHDSLVFSLEDNGTVTIAGFFADESALPAFTLPDGSLVVAEAFFEAFSPELSAAPDSAKTGAPPEDGLDESIEGVQGLGALGTFYWGDGKLLVTEDAEDSDLDASAFHMGYSGSSGSASYLYAQNNYGSLVTGVSGTESVEVSPGYYTPGETHKESIPLPGSNESWAVSGALTSCQTSAGEEKTGLTGTSGGDNPFEGSGFDIEALIQKQSSLADWTMDADAFGCITREVSVAENAAGAKIEIDWSMLAGGQESQASDVTIALLFKVGPDGELIYVDHSTVTFSERNADGMFKDASGHASWTVEPGERYVVSLVVAGKHPGGGQGPVLVVDSVEHTWNTEPVWIAPVYEDVPVAVYSALGNVISDPLDGETPLNNAAHASGVDYHSDGLAFSVTRFFLNGEWHDSGDAVNWQDAAGTECSFAMDARGEYSFSMKGAGAPSLKDLDIIYEIESADGLKDQATLYLRGMEQTPREGAEKGGENTGLEGADAAYAIHAGDASPAASGQGALQDDDGMAAIPEGSANGSGHDAQIADIFSMTESDWLFFADLLEGTEELETLLESGDITLSRQGETLSLDIATDAGENRHIDVTVEKGTMDSFVAEYTHQNGTAEGMEQALLQLILCGT